MKRDVDYPEYEEYNSFRLTNEQRPYFGLDPIREQWEEVEIKEGTTVFYEGDIVRKIITWERFHFYKYLELDIILITHDRQYILPKTAKGKEKKITPTNLLSFMPSGCIISISLKVTGFNSRVEAFNRRNNIQLPITDDEEIVTISELKQWLAKYIETCPVGYFDKVEKMRTMPHRTINYNVGDIFRFEIDREYYGFGIIIGKIHELKKLGFFCEDHPMLSTMTIPLLIRLYLIKTPDENTPLSEIIKAKLLPADLMSDNEILWGTHEIIGPKSLEPNDIDFPMQCGCVMSQKKTRTAYFAWGAGVIKLENIENIPKELSNRNFNNDGVALSLPIYQLNRVLQGQSEYNVHFDLLHPDNDELIKKIFKLFQIPFEIDFDTFNRQNNGMTRKEYIDYVIDNSSLARSSKRKDQTT